MRHRAWTICGLAIRHALALGLHVRSEADSVSDAEKEHRVRLWWSLYSLECLLNELTGRPSCISDRDISTPLPLNIDESGLRTGQGLYEGMEDIQRAGSSSRRGSQNSRGESSLSIEALLTRLTRSTCCNIPNANWRSTTAGLHISYSRTSNHLLHILHLSDATVYNLS